MAECEHIWIRVDDDCEGDYAEGPSYVRTIAAYMECLKCGERKPAEDLDEENENV